MLICFYLLLFQNTEPRFERLSVLDGLSQSQVLAIAQDEFGFMWFGTQDGLNRYDGYQFQVFRNDSDTHPLSDNHIQALLVDQANVLWIGTRAGGLMRWDLNTDDFQTFRHIQGDSSSLGADDIWSIYQDRQKRIWIATLGGGLNLWLPQQKAFRRMLHQGIEDEIPASLHVRSVFEDEAGHLWFSSDGGLHKLDPTLSVATHYQHNPDDASSLQSGKIMALTGEQHNQIWVASLGGGLSLFNPESETFTHYRNDPSNPQSLSNNNIWSMYRDTDQRLWLGTMDRGLNLWQPDTHSFKVFRHTRHSKSLSSNKIWSIFEDRSGILWLGTGDHGTNKLNMHAKPFMHLPKPSDDQSVSENLVTMTIAPREEAIWIGTWGQGLLKMDPDNGSFEKMELRPTPTGSPRMFVSLYPENETTMWMGVWGAGLTKLDLTSLEETRFKWDFGAVKSNYNVIHIMPFQNKLLLSTYGDGVVLFDPATADFSRLENERGPLEELASGNFFSSLLKSGDDLWLATVGKGIYRLNLTTMELKNYQREEQQSYQLPSNRITVLFNDSKDTIWVGTDGGGLARFVPDLDGFMTITSKTGLPSNVINGILQDETGKLWVSTNKGLDCFDPELETHRIFGPEDGLQVEYNAGVFAASPQGLFFFGGQNGFDYFDPLEIKQNPYIPDVVFSQFKVFNQSRALEKPLNKTTLIELNHKDNFFAFEFASMDFSSPGKNRFRVKLEGVDKDWVFNGTRNYKEYTNLSGGTYTFSVQGSNGDGVWNEFGRQIKVRIIPPFWQTRTFLIGSALVLLFLVGGIVHSFERKKILHLKREQAEQSELNKRLAEAREVERLRIAQEIHDGPIQDLHAIQFQLSLAKEKNDYSNIGKYLLSVISSLRRLCGHLRPPALIPFGLAAAIRSLVDTMRDKYPDMNIALNLEADGQKIPEDVRLALFRICQEALNNALQHSGGATVKILFKVDRAGIHLVISDDGVGFVLGESLLAFSSSGHYGLLGISERAQSIGGNVSINTSPGQGTRIKVLIPKDKSLLIEAAAFA